MIKESLYKAALLASQSMGDGLKNMSSFVSNWAFPLTKKAAPEGAASWKRGFGSHGEKAKCQS